MEPRPQRSRCDEVIRVAVQELERRRAMIDADGPLGSVTVAVTLDSRRPNRAIRAVVKTDSAENVPLPFER